MIVVEVVGWAGAVAVLVAYALIIRTPEAVTGAPYLALNLAGSAGLAVSGAAHAAWPSAVLNLLWLGLALHGFRTSRAARRTTRVGGTAAITEVACPSCVRGGAGPPRSASAR